MKPMATAAGIANTLHVDEADVRHLISTIEDLHDDDIPTHIVGAIHKTLNPHCERTVPELYGWAEEDL